MKINQRLFLSGLAVAIMLMAGCGGDDDPKPTLTEIQFEKLSGITWVVNQVSRDNNTVTDEFPNFTLQFFGSLNNDKTNVNGNYTTTNGGDVFPSGTWSFSESNIDDLIIRVVGSTQYPTQYTVTETSITLSFTYSAGTGGGRTKILDGDYVFSLSAAQ